MAFERKITIISLQELFWIEYKRQNFLLFCYLFLLRLVFVPTGHCLISHSKLAYMFHLFSILCVAILYNAARRKLLYISRNYKVSVKSLTRKFLRCKRLCHKGGIWFNEAGITYLIGFCWNELSANFAFPYWAKWLSKNGLYLD